MKRIAIIVGVNSYRAPITSLKCAERDAIDMYALFKRLPGYADVSHFTGTTAQRADEVRRGIERKLGTVGPGDLAVLYFAGHGTMKKATGEQLLLFPDADVDNLDYYTGAIVLEQIKRVVRKRGCNCLIVLDACRNSLCDNTRAAVPAGSAGLRDLTVSTTGLKDSAPDVVPDLAIYYGCQEGRCSAERGEHGLFTGALMAVMEEAREANREVRFDEAFRRAVFGKMELLGKGAVGQDQRPTPYGDLSVPLLEGRAAATPSVSPKRHPGNSDAIAADREANALDDDVEGSFKQRTERKKVLGTAVSKSRPDSFAMPENTATGNAALFKLFEQAKSKKEDIARFSDEHKAVFAGLIREFVEDFNAAETARSSSDYAAALTLVTQAMKKVKELEAKRLAAQIETARQKINAAISAAESDYRSCDAFRSDKILQGNKNLKRIDVCWAKIRGVELLASLEEATAAWKKITSEVSDLRAAVASLRKQVSRSKATVEKIEKRLKENFIPEIAKLEPTILERVCRVGQRRLHYREEYENARELYLAGRYAEAEYHYKLVEELFVKVLSTGLALTDFERGRDVYRFRFKDVDQSNYWVSFMLFVEESRSFFRGGENAQFDACKDALKRLGQAPDELREKVDKMLGSPWRCTCLLGGHFWGCCCLTFVTLVVVLLPDCCWVLCDKASRLFLQGLSFLIFFMVGYSTMMTWWCMRRSRSRLRKYWASVKAGAVSDGV